MTRGQGLLLGTLAILAVVVWAAILGGGALGGRDASSSPDLAGGPSSDQPTPAPSPTTPAPSSARPQPATTDGAPPSATVPPSAPTPTADPAGTAQPAQEPDDPRLAYAEFRLRLADARDHAMELNDELRDAGEAGSPEAVRAVAVEILDFADEERDWLRDHPPAACYRDAHAAAEAMVAAYATVGEEALRWTAAEGLDALAALAAVYDAAEAATAAAVTLGSALGSTGCPA